MTIVFYNVIDVLGSYVGNVLRMQVFRDVGTSIIKVEFTSLISLIPHPSLQFHHHQHPYSKKFYWIIVDLKDNCMANLLYGKVSQLNIYIYPLCSKFFSHIGL